MMPALPGAHLVLVHPRLTFASLKAGLNAEPGFDDPRQFHQRQLLSLHLGCLSRCKVVAITVAGVVIGSIQRGLSFQPVLIRERLTGDYQPLLGTRPFAFE